MSDDLIQRLAAVAASKTSEHEMALDASGWSCCNCSSVSTVISKMPGCNNACKMLKLRRLIP